MHRTAHARRRARTHRRPAAPPVTGPRGPPEPGGTRVSDEPAPTTEPCPSPPALSEQIARTGLFGTETTGDTSGYGGLRVRRAPVPSSPRPYRAPSTILDRLADGMEQEAEGSTEERRVMHTIAASSHPPRSRRDRLNASVAKVLDEPSLAFELCLGEQHALPLKGRPARSYTPLLTLLSITHNPAPAAGRCSAPKRATHPHRW